MSHVVSKTISKRLYSFLFVAVVGLVVGVLFNRVAFADVEKADKFVQSAIEYLQKGDHNTAVIELKNALQQSPKHAKARALLGQAYLRKNSILPAEKELKRAMDLGAERADWVSSLGEVMLLLGKHDEIFDTFVISPEDKPSIKAEILSIQGASYLAQGELDKARGKYIEATGFDNTNASLNLGLARIAVVDNDSEKALSLVDGVIDRSPNHVMAWMLKGVILAKVDQLEASEQALNKALEINSDHLMARLTRANIYVDLKAFDKAREDIKRMKEMVPRLPSVNFLSAKISFLEQDFDTALKALLEVVAVEDSHLQANSMLGYIYYQRGQYRQAEEALLKFTSRARNYVPALKMLGASRIHLDRTESAIEVLKRAEAQAPDDVQLLVLMSQAYTRLGQNDEAIKYLSRATEIQPDAERLQTQLAAMRIRQGDLDMAVEDLSNVVADDKSSIQSNVLYVATLLKQKEYDKAVAHAQSVIDKSPDEPLAHNLMGSVFMAQEKLDEARKHFEKALDLDEKFVTAMTNLGRIAGKQKRYDDSIDYFERILDVEPNDVIAMLSIARVYEEKGDAQKALEWVKIAWERGQQNASAGELLVRHYLGKKDFLKALNIAKSLEQKQPNSPRAHQLLGSVNAASKNYPSAVSNYRRAINLQPRNLQSYLSLAGVYFTMDRIQDAVATFDEALEIQADYLPALVGKAEIMLKTNQIDRARNIARGVQSAYPDSVVGYQLEASADVQQQQYVKAANLYKKVHTIQPTSRHVILYAQSLYKAGKGDVGTTVLEDWLANNAADNRARFTLASLYQQLQKNAEAMKHYEVIVEADPTNQITLNNLTWLHYQTNSGQAVIYADKLAALKPTQPPVLDTIGWVLVNHDQLERGVEFLKQAVEKAPTFAEARYHLAVAYQKQGKNAQAKRMLARIFEENTTPSFEGVEEARKLYEQFAAAE